MTNDYGLACNPEPPEPRTVAHCCECGGEIYAEEFFGYDGKTSIHIDCIDDLWHRLKTAEKLNYFGYSTVTRE